MMRDILGLGNKITICLFIVGCNQVETTSLTNHSLYLKKSLSKINKTEYDNIYTAACDSLKIWSINNLGYYQYLGKSKNYNLDSLLCFNTNSDRFIGSLVNE